MANFFDGIWKAITHPVDEAEFLWKNGVEDVGGNLLKGNFSEAFDELKQIPGEHQRMMNEQTVPLLGNNKIATNSDAIAGAVIGGIMAAPAIGSALGGSGASAGGGASSAGSGGFSSFGTQGATQGMEASNTSWFDTILQELSSSGENLLGNTDTTSQPKAAEKSAFEQHFSEMLSMQRKLAMLPPAERNKLFASEQSKHVNAAFTNLYNDLTKD